MLLSSKNWWLCALLLPIALQEFTNDKGHAPVKHLTSPIQKQKYPKFGHVLYFMGIPLLARVGIYFLRTISLESSLYSLD